MPEHLHCRCEDITIVVKMAQGHQLVRFQVSYIFHVMYGIAKQSKVRDKYYINLAALGWKFQKRVQWQETKVDICRLSP